MGCSWMTVGVGLGPGEPTRRELGSKMILTKAITVPAAADAPPTNQGSPMRGKASSYGKHHPSSRSAKPRPDVRNLLLNQADHVASLRYAPTGVVCDENLRAVDFRGNMKDYLRASSGSASLKIDRLFSSDCAKRIVNAIHDIRSGRSNDGVQGVSIESSSGTRLVDIEIVPMSETGVEWYFVFILDKADARREIEAADYERHAGSALDDVAMDPASAIRRLKSSNAWLRKRNVALLDARSALEEERDHAEAVIQGIHQPLLILDGSIRVVRANPAFLSLFGTTAEDVEMRPLNELGDGQWSIESLLRAMLQLMEDGGVLQDFELECALSEGEPSTLSLNAKKIGWGSRALILVAVEDITTKKNLLVRLSEALQKEERFITTLGHDVREAMQPLHDAATLLQKRDISVPAAQQAISVLNRQMKQMNHAIADHLNSTDRPSSVGELQNLDIADRGEVLKNDDVPARNVGSEAAPAPFASRRILVIDDNLDTAAMCALSLTLEGHVVEIAHDGASALKMAKAFRPDIVILDIGLPGMSGMDVAKDIRQHEGSNKAMIVGLSGYDQDAYRQQAEEAGFDHYLVKPSSASQINKVIATHH